MPEGDTIFRTARALGRALAGKAIIGFESTYPLLTRFHDDTPLTTQSVESVESRGKWLLMHFSGGATLATHMLMNGSWHIYRHGERWQQPRANMRILIKTAEFVAVGFRVPVAQIHTARSLAQDRRIPSSALDVLSPDFDAQASLHRVMAHSQEEVADVLLHQEVLAGVGNVFKSEVCFVCGIHPFSKVSALYEKQIGSLIAAAQKLIRANLVEDSEDSIVTFRGLHRRTTHDSDPAASLWVYGRHGEPCRRCGERIERRLQGPDARVTFWCPRCQPMPS